MYKSWLVAIGFAALLALIWLLVGDLSASPPNSPPPAKASAEPSSTRRSSSPARDHARRRDAEIARLRSDVDALRDDAERRAFEQGDGAGDELAVVADPAELEAMEAERVLQVSGFYNDRVDSEPHDAAWTADQEEHIAGLLADGAFGDNELASIACAAGLCRLVVKHGSEDARGQLETLWLSARFRGGGYSEWDQASNSSTLFVGRAGHDFPDPPPAE